MTKSHLVLSATSTDRNGTHDLFSTHLEDKLHRLYGENDPDHSRALQRLSEEIAVIRREKYDEYFLDLADVVMLAKHNRARFWCLWEPLNRSLVAHLLGANPLNPVAWQLPPPRWPEIEANRPPHLTMMLHLSDTAEPVVRRAAIKHFGELAAYKLGILPEESTADDRVFINSQPAHIALWTWTDIELQERCLELIRQNCQEQIEPEKLPVDSAQVFDLFYKGHILGLFHTGVIPNNYFSSCFQKLRPRSLQDLAVILGHFSPKGIAKMEVVCKKRGLFLKAPPHSKAEEIGRLFNEMPSPAQSLSTAWFAYQMAWLKIRYPNEFYSALLSSPKINARMLERVMVERLPSA